MGKHDPTLQARLLAHLKRRHTGRANAVPSRRLEKKFGIAGSTLRRAVLCLRRAGEPVCSDAAGYYYAADFPELWSTIDRLETRLTGSSMVVRGLRGTAKSMPGNGQTRLNDGEVDAHQ